MNILRGFAKWMNLVRASWCPYAAKIGVTISLDEVDIERSQRIDIVVVTGIVVPCGGVSITMGMNKCYDRWQTLVVTKYVRELQMLSSHLKEFCHSIATVKIQVCFAIEKVIGRS